MRANFFTKVGFIWLFISIFSFSVLFTFSESIPHIIEIPLAFLATIILMASLSALIVTGFGFDTFKTYLRTKRVLERTDIEYIRENVLGDGYCGEVGVALAIEDSQSADR